MRGSEADLVVNQAGAMIFITSSVDERVGALIAARDHVEAVSGMFVTAARTDRVPQMLVQGRDAQEYLLRAGRSDSPDA